MVNRWRAVRRQRNLVLEPGLDRLLVLAAKSANMSVNGFVVALIEEACGAGSNSESRVGDGIAAAGVGVGLSGGGFGDGNVERVSGEGRHLA